MAESLTINSDKAFGHAVAALNGWYQSVRYLRVTVEFGPDRNDEQNDKMWAMLTDIAKQVTWYGKTYNKDQWKDILTGSFKSCEFVPNTEGSGFVAIGLSTSKMGKKKFSEFIEFIRAFGDTQMVKWSNENTDDEQSKLQREQQE